ncbi:MAG: helix-turn-helix domain-containing protein [Gaiellaceae bacterium]
MSTSPRLDSETLAGVLGMRLNERRRELGKKLAEIANVADVSVGYLSSIEKGNSVPSLSVLARLSHALEMTLAEMLRTSASSQLARGRLSAKLGSAPLAADGSQMQIVQLGARPGSRGRAPLRLGGGDVFVYLHSGRLAVDVDGAPFELAAGDALHCDRPSSLRWEALGAERAVSVWTAATPPARSAS